MVPLKLLFVAAEMAPLVKVGGLGDVLGALPPALAARGHDVRVLLPAYQRHMTRGATSLGRLSRGRGRLLELRETALPCPVWLFETPGFLRRDGRPYLTRAGTPWMDDPLQFGRLARVAADIATGMQATGWQPDVIHCNDWHTGLTPVWMQLDGAPAASVFSIHNLGYVGRFPPGILDTLGLPVSLNHPEALEFHGDIAFMKGGLRFADRLTTVSPRYAGEILTPAFGAGLDGLLRARADRLTGILNGIDNTVWDPATDDYLESRFDAEHLAGKSRERQRLKHALGLLDADSGPEPVVAWIGRLAAQKGADLLLDALPALLRLPLQLAVLGSGDPALERALSAAARRQPGRLAVRIGFDEGLAHRLYAGADMLLMPSRFEPCGLAQLCAMRYGTIPLVTPVGGLADTVVDVDDPAAATGFHLAEPSAPALLAAVGRALKRFGSEPDAWRRMMVNAMGQRYDWDASAVRYEEVYRAALADRAARSAA